ncbi:MAG TPA: alpha-1,2-fucosyltransferase [Candidatus Paceibacterota bacterium]
MIVLQLKAGLGNQMFQYAFAKALALRSGQKLALDLSWFENVSERDTSRTFGLNHFNIDAEILPANSPLARHSTGMAFIFRKIAAKIKRMFVNTDYAYSAFEARPRESATVSGYWNSEKYFADFAADIRRDLQLKNDLSPEARSAKEEVLRAISDKKTLILIHVRRGDYVTNAHAHAAHGLSSLEYYKLAIERIMGKIIKDAGGFDKENSLFVLASDDMDWTVENIVPHLPTSHIALSGKGLKDFEELHIMSLCHHFIIANSTFSWWAAWLSDTAAREGKKKIVIAPNAWVADPKTDTRDVIPEAWTRI